MRVRAQWSRQAQFLWIVALIAAGLLAWWEWRSLSPAPPGPPAAAEEGEWVELEVVAE